MAERRRLAVVGKYWKLFFFLILLVFPFGQIFRWQIPFLPEARLQPLDFLVFGFVLLWAGEKLLKHQPFRWPKLFRAFLVFWGLAAVSLALQIGRLSSLEWLVALFYLLRLGNCLLFYPALVDFFSRENLSLKKIFLFEGLVIASLAFLQYLFLPDTRFLLFSGWDEHLFRAIGTFLDPGFTGVILVLALLPLLADFFQKGKRSLVQVLPILFLTLVIGLSFARATYLALAAGVLVILLALKKLPALLLVGLFFVLLIIALPKPAGEGVNLWRTNSILARLKNYEAASLIIRNNFWTGVGFNAYRFAQEKSGLIPPSASGTAESWQSNNAASSADNSFLFVLATTGIFGFGAFVYLWLRLFKEGWEQRKKSLWLLASLSALTVSAFFLNTLFYPWILAWLMLSLSSTAGSE